MGSRTPFRQRPRPRDLAIAAVLAVCVPGGSAALDMARYLPPAGAAYVAEEVGVRCPARHSLAGTLTLPTRGVLRDGRVLRYAAVVLLGGAEALDRDGVTAGDTAASAGRRPLFDLADTLTRRGVAVLRLDARGVGASTGTLDSATTLDRADDARAAIGFLRRRTEIDPRRIAVLGMNDGASIAALVAATDPEVRGIVLMGAPWRRTDARYDPRITARAVSTPALVLHGDADDDAPPKGADSLAAALRESSDDVTLRRFPDLGHDFLPAPGAAAGFPAAEALRLAPVVRGATADWLLAHLGGAEVGPAPRPRSRPRRHRR